MPATVATTEIAEKLCKALEAGLPLRPACQAAGISRDAYYGWRERAAKGEEPYATAVAAVDKARGVLQATLVGRVLALARSGTKNDTTKLNATKWALEKLFPEDFGNRVEVTGAEGAPLQSGPAVIVLGPYGADDGKPLDED